MTWFVVPFCVVAAVYWLATDGPRRQALSILALLAAGGVGLGVEAWRRRRP